jgi:hypothetical protein
LFDNFVGSASLVQITGEVAMSEPRGWIKILAGGSCVFFAICFLLIGPLLYALEMPLTTSLTASAFAILPAILAVALLWPSKRNIAIRAMGVIVFLPVCGACIYQLLEMVGVLEASSGTRPRLRTVGILAAIGVAAFWMAWKGRWPDEGGAESVPVSEEQGKKL